MQLSSVWTRPGKIISQAPDVIVSLHLPSMSKLDVTPKFAKLPNRRLGIPWNVGSHCLWPSVSGGDVAVRLSHELLPNVCSYALSIGSRQNGGLLVTGHPASILAKSEILTGSMLFLSVCEGSTGCRDVCCGFQQASAEKSIGSTSVLVDGQQLPALCHESLCGVLSPPSIVQHRVSIVSQTFHTRLIIVEWSKITKLNHVVLPRTPQHHISPSSGRRSGTSKART